MILPKLINGSIRVSFMVFNQETHKKGDFGKTIYNLRHVVLMYL